MKYSSIAKSLGVAGASIAVALSGIAGASAVSAQEGNPLERGPAPSESSLQASRGPFALGNARVTGASGFGGGTIYYPNDTSAGTFGGVVIAPGFTAGSSTYSGIAQRIASHGFVVLNIDTNSRMDQPASRGRQIEAALDYLVESSPAKDRVDPERLATSGHSMGGGGALNAAESHENIEATVPLTPWHTDTRWEGLTVPTMVIAAQSDMVAPTGTHAKPIYNSLSDSVEKAYVELSGESHLVPAMNPADMGAPVVAWLKRYVDNDTRYEQFLCPAQSGRDYSAWEDSCPGEDGGDGETPPPGAPPTTAPPEEECAWYEWWC